LICEEGTVEKFQEDGVCVGRHSERKLPSGDEATRGSALLTKDDEGRTAGPTVNSKIHPTRTTRHTRKTPRKPTIEIRVSSKILHSTRMIHRKKTYNNQTI
jgi:hypothetical protein